jgi:hypothetical protein
MWAVVTLLHIHNKDSLWSPVWAAGLHRQAGLHFHQYTDFA